MRLPSISATFCVAATIETPVLVYTVAMAIDNSMSLDDVVAATRRASLASHHPQRYRECDFLGWVEAIAQVESLGQEVRGVAAAEAAEAIIHFDLGHVIVPPVSPTKVDLLAEAFNGVAGEAERDRHAGVWLAHFIAEMYTVY